jgi:two-component system, cell cycle response regulator DivK
MSSTSRRPVVLLVQQARDDALEMYAEFLRYHRLVPITASNERDARLLARHADIIVTGITLDGPADGIELIVRLRDDDGTRHTPIIVLTACAWAEDRERAEHAGCDVFLPKPCLPNDLLREVRLLLSAHRGRYGECTGASTAASTNRETLANAHAMMY